VAPLKQLSRLYHNNFQLHLCVILAAATATGIGISLARMQIKKGTVDAWTPPSLPLLFYLITFVEWVYASSNNFIRIRDAKRKISSPLPFYSFFLLSLSSLLDPSERISNGKSSCPSFSTGSPVGSGASLSTLYLNTSL
jgi:hypothetical protein